MPDIIRSARNTAQSPGFPVSRCCSHGGVAEDVGVAAQLLDQLLIYLHHVVQQRARVRLLHRADEPHEVHGLVLQVQQGACCGVNNVTIRSQHPGTVGTGLGSRVPVVGRKLCSRCT